MTFRRRNSPLALLLSLGVLLWLLLLTRAALQPRKVVKVNPWVKVSLQATDGAQLELLAKSFKFEKPKWVKSKGER